jgi:hypothetical protein
MAQTADDNETTGHPAIEAVESMAKYGITRVRIDNFCYGGFRYTNLDDAIAEAKRHPPGSAA